MEEIRLRGEEAEFSAQKTEHTFHLKIRLRNELN
jgi:hypothetical protein